MDKDKLIYIAKNTSNYLETSSKTLDSRLEKVKITEEEKEDIVAEKTIKTVLDKGLSLFGPVGDAISTILNWNSEVNQDISEAKKMILLEQYFNKADEYEVALISLKDFLINPQGNTLFNKILRIIDDSPPDEELMQHLSSALKTIINSKNFEELFNQHKYALAQIERLTPQALTIISDYKKWPPIKLNAVTAFGPKVTSDWYSEFTNVYCQLKGISDEHKYKRIMHSVRELQNQSFIEAYNGPNDMAYCQLTHVGKDLIPYIS
ncbi:hypothetical protein P9597_02290 [Aneurinibacillus migulanus]|uniref:hypothetical protein n=1 Tax=Aneurinibacillus migulanus TaxID=47500 RepID=UPI002E1ACD68|nr:hypothetical protein [Aneurinibacillus migulanus]